MQPHIQQAFTAIGQAVWHSQVLEAALVPIFEFFKMQTREGYLEKTSGYVRLEAFKQPLKNLVKDLAARGELSESLGAALDRYIDDRNLLVHRWFMTHGWANEADEASWRTLTDHAASVTGQAQAITHAFAAYMVEHADPEVAKVDPEGYKMRMEDLFRKVEPT